MSQTNMSAHRCPAQDKLHAATEADAQYFLEHLAGRLSQCRSFATSVLSYGQRHADIIRDLHQDGYVIVKNHFRKERIHKLRKQVKDLVDHRVGLSPLNGQGTIRSEHVPNGRAHDGLPPCSVHVSTSLEKAVSSVGVQDPLLALSDTLPVVFDEGILEMAAAYYGAVPMVTFLKVRHAFSNALAPADTQLFHADGGSFRIFKALVYLQDVHEGDGPFCYVRGSHRRKWRGWEQRARYTDAEIEAVYGPEAVSRCYADAGDVILADTTGIHRGEKPVNRDRSILIVNYCLHPEYGFEHPHISIKKRDRDSLSPLCRLAAEHLVEVE